MSLTRLMPTDAFKTRFQCILFARSHLVMVTCILNGFFLIRLGKIPLNWKSQMRGRNEIHGFLCDETRCLSRENLEDFVGKSAYPDGLIFFLSLIEEVGNIFPRITRWGNEQRSSANRSFISSIRFFLLSLQSNLILSRANLIAQPS